MRESLGRVRRERQAFDLHAAGMLALDVARVEAGLLLIEVDYTSSKKALIPSQKFSPYELGFAKMVHPQRKLRQTRIATRREERRAAPACRPRSRLDRHRATLHRYGLTPAAPTQASRVAVPIYSGDKQIGKATTTSWSPILKKKLIALASIETEYSKPGTSLQMEITIEAMRLKTNVKVTPLPFFDPREKRPRPRRCICGAAVPT